MESQSGNLELFEKEILKEFQKINITAIADYIIDTNKSLIIIGDSSGTIRTYKREGSKLTENQQVQKGNLKIDKLIVNNESNILYVLSGGSLFLLTLPNLGNVSSKDIDKDVRDLKDIVKIIQNECPKNKSEIMVITKKKKVLFFSYENEIQKLLIKEYKDKDKKNLDIVLKEMPDKIKWYGNNFCYYSKQSSKIIFSTIRTKNEVSKLIEASQDIPVEDIAFIQSSWTAVFPGGLCFFFDTDGQNKNKNMISLNNTDPFYELEIFNDLYIVSLHEKSIGIYDYKDEKCVQELTIDTSDVSVKKFLCKGSKSIFLISTIKKEEKGKQEIISNLWELREFSFEKQIKLALKFNQIEKAFGILNNKLEYNVEKFVFLESFYCDCGWNCLKKKNKEGYEEAEKYFSLCNFNPFELIYHFIKLLEINPIHENYKNLDNLPKEVLACQINGDIEKDENVLSALKMLISTLQSKKTYLLSTIEREQKGRKIDIVEEAKSRTISFESSQNCDINLKDEEPKDVKIFDVIKIINEVLVKGMVLLKKNISTIEDIIENDQFNEEYSESFLSNINTFTSNMALAYIYKKNKNYSEAFNKLEGYINDLGRTVENKEARTLLQKILISFGKNYEYADVFEQGLKILLKNHFLPAFEILLSNELISIENFLELLDDIDKNNNQGMQSKKELFLKLLCEDKKYSNYSNEKHQTLYMELLLNKLFSEVKKEYVPPPKDKDAKEYEGLPNKYKNFKELFTKFTKYNKDHLLELIKDSWMYDIIIFLLTETQKYNEAIEKLVELVKTRHKSFEDIREYCKINYKNDTNIFREYFTILKKNYDDKEIEGMKPKFKKEMLKILELFINGNLLDEEVKKNKNKLELLNLLNPKDILKLIPSDWKLSETLDPNAPDKTLFNVLRFYLKEYAIINNNYKRLENLAKMDLIYKQLKLYDLRDKHVLLDINTSCYLCNKKIQNNTVFLVYPNGHIYHSRCSPDLHIEIKTGRNFENFDY